MPVTTTAVIPLKALSQAKGRLADALGPDQRRELTAWMFGRVLHACAGAPQISDVLVVAGNAQTAALTTPFDVRTVVEQHPGLNLAMAMADRLLADRDATLVIAADLPLLGPEDIAEVCAAAAEGASVVVAPTHDGGTGGLLRRPPNAISTAFGAGSAAAHRRLAEEAGLSHALVRTEGFGFDVDTPGQLAALPEGHLPWPA